MTELERKLALPEVKIDMGSGAHNMRQPLDEWIRIDGYADEKIDIVCDFGHVPLPPKCADFMWSGDTIEHIPGWEMKTMLGEWNRLIKIGGRFEGQTPNLHATMVRYVKGEVNLLEAIMSLYGFHNHPYQQHYITYTTDTLTDLLKEYGFDNVTFTGSPGVAPGDEKNAWWLCFQCVKVKDV